MNVTAIYDYCTALMIMLMLMLMPTLANVAIAKAPGTVKEGLVGPYVQMPLYDIGMTSLLVSEAESLAELADVLGRTSTAAMLRDRCDSMRALMNANLWYDDIGKYQYSISTVQ